MANLVRVSPNLIKGLSLSSSDGSIPVKAGNSFTFTKTLSGLTLSSSAISGSNITNSSVDSTPIGDTTRSTGKFTTLNTTGSTVVGDTLDVTSSSTLRGNNVLGTNTSNSHTVNGGVNVTGTVTTPAVSSTTRSLFSGTQTTDMATATGSLGGLEVRSSGAGSAAMMAFHRPGAHAIYFGVDTDNQLKIGGWSLGNVAYPIMYAGSNQIPGAAPVYAVRAWVNFNGASSAVPIRGAGNIVMTYLGVGNYRATMAVPMPDVNYCVIPGNNGDSPINSIATASPASTTQFTIGIVYRTGGSSTVRSNNTVVTAIVVR